ncbi:MAG TPA: DinB family protein [Planctomycetota bacterium]|nr:DinB family protein [Planctomycetota bacterium]
MLDAVLGTSRLYLAHLRRLTDDLSEEALTQAPAGAPPNGAWTLGHVAYSFQALGEELGLPPWLPPTFRDAFAPGSRAAAAGGPAPAIADVRAALEDGARRTAERMRALGPAGLAAPLPDARFRDRLPTVGHCAAYVLCCHLATHVALAAAWRRAAGYPAAGDALLG